MGKMGKILSNFVKIARTNSISVPAIEYVNPTIDVGVVHQVYGHLPQIKFFTNEAVKSASLNLTVDSIYNTETGRGKIEVVNTNDYYIGEGIAEWK